MRRILGTSEGQHALVALCSSVVFVVVACRGRDGKTTEDVESRHRSLGQRGHAAQVAASVRLPTVIGDSVLGGLVDSLRRLHGSFQVRGAPPDYQFVGQTSVFQRFSEHGDSAVIALVDCLDRTDPSATTLGGRPVSLGIMCSEALSRVALYEATDSQGDLDADWPGYVNATASQSALVAAKHAWSPVLKRHMYQLRRDF